MPLYDFDCHDCKIHSSDVYLTLKEHETHREICPLCEKPMEQSFKSSTEHRPFKAYWDEHISPNGPVYVESHAQRVKLLKENHSDFRGTQVGNPRCEV
jgi:hypothetical protein